MRVRILVTAVVAVLALFNGKAGIAESLDVTSVTSSGCANPDTFAQGQQVRLRGGGFSPGATVEVKFECCGQPGSFPSVTASGSGTIDTTVTLPAVTNGWPLYPVDAMLMARNVATPTELLTAGVILGPPGAVVDTDTDTRPDFCDNCKSNPNVTQDDADQDGVGDACDSCPTDATNDADNDGICEGGVSQCPNDPANDQDLDGVCGNVDNCPIHANPGQIDSDGNGVGDACPGPATCSDGRDNDGDGRVDFPADRGCTSATDIAETESSLICDDGLDNDHDGKTDFHATLGYGDPGCGLWWDVAVAEKTECDDGVDNNGDGKYDWDGWNGEFERDANCSVFGFGTSETVPEPKVGHQLGVVVCVVLSAMRRRRKAFGA